MSRRSFNDKLGNIIASTYDAFDRLLTASNASHSASYTYDGLGRRRTKTVDSINTAFADAGDQEMVEYAGNTVSGVQTAGQLLRHFVYGLGIDEPLDMMTPSTVASPANDTHRYIVPDIGGSVLALLDPTQSGSAALVSQYGYRPFGESGDSTGADLPLNFHPAAVRASVVVSLPPTLDHEG